MTDKTAPLLGYRFKPGKCIVDSDFANEFSVNLGCTGVYGLMRRSGMQTRHAPLPCGVSALLLNPDRPKQKARLGVCSAHTEETNALFEAIDRDA